MLIFVRLILGGAIMLVVYETVYDILIEKF